MKEATMQKSHFAQHHPPNTWVALLMTLFVLGVCMTSDYLEAGEELAVLVEGTGKYTRPISTDSELAQKFFDQGLRLTWGYYFPEAIASHQEALRHDPDHPMIYWGLALALGPIPNSRYFRFPDDPLGEGKKAIDRARELIDKASEKERAFIEALYVRYDSSTIADRDARDDAYLKATKALMELYPEDPDAVGLYADAHMTTTPWNYWDEAGLPRKGTEEVAAALEKLMERRPDYPGANHLYIHLIEASPTPERALPQADRLEALMPIAGHIVHMPSHIYVRVGQYAKAIATNERSVAADEKFLAIWGDHPFPMIGTYKLSAQFHASHAYDFIRYAASVQGNYEKAIEIARISAERTPQHRIEHGMGQRNLATVWLVHKMFGKWDALLAEDEPMEGYPYIEGMWRYARGSAYVGRGNLAQAEEELATLHTIAKEKALESVLTMAAPATTILKLAALGLEGEIKQAKGDLEGAIAAFESAVRIEDTLPYMAPPDWAQPMRHYLGAALLEAGRAKEAEKVYREDLSWNQNNGWALFGLWQSLRDQGKSADGEQVRALFEDAWKGADVKLTASRF